jgi:hypothetical protein
MTRYKYPRTYHLPWSDGLINDDKRIASIDHFIGKEIVVSEKLDGENTSFSNDYIHARSVDSRNHPSRNWVKALHGKICHEIPSGWRITGENVFACHSIHYHNLNDYFYVFGIYNENNICLSWKDTLLYCEMLGLTPVPILYSGIWNEQKVKACFTGESTASPGDPQEGYVVRITDSYPYVFQNSEFNEFAAKMVRKNHIQTTEFWMNQPVKPNLLRV